MSKNQMGFRYAWSSWSILVAAFITVFFHRLSVGSVADELTRDIPMNALTLGNLTAMNYYAYALMQIPVGILADRIGIVKINVFGLLVTAAGSMLFGFAHSIEIAYLSRFMVGMGTSVVFVSIFKVQATWFPLSRFSALASLTALFGNFGSLLALYPLTYLSLTLGWRNVFYVIGGISLLLVFFVLWGVRDAKLDLQQSPGSSLSFAAFLKESLSSVLSNRRTWPNILILFAFTGSSTTLLGLWGIPLLTRIYSLDKTVAAGYLTLTTFGFIIGAPLVSILARWLKGVRPPLLVGTGLNLALWIYITVFAGGRPPEYFWPPFFFVFGLLIMTHILAFSNVTAVNSLRYSGIASAVTNMGEFIGSSVASLAIGLILDLSGKPSQAWWIILIMAALGFCGALKLKEENPLQS